MQSRKDVESERTTLATGWRGDPVVQAVLALGITQITAWGTTYYLLGVLATPIMKDTGWSRSIVFLGFSIALLVMSLVSTRIGRMIDQRGGQFVMSLGSIACAIGLGALAFVTSEWAYLAVWAFLGIAMRMTLYDAAFSAIVQVDVARGRRAISYLTLFGGFASSVFWPIGHYLATGIGWRQTLILFALLNLAVCLPLHWLGLPRRRPEPATKSSGASAAPAAHGQPLEGRARLIAMVLFAGVMSLNGFAMSALSVHLVPVLEATGIGTVAAVWLASLKGVAQVGGRIVEMTAWRNFHPVTVGRIALALVPLSLLIVYLGSASFAVALAFTLILGSGQGIITIVRGAVPLALFGSNGYGEVLGRIATPILLMNALAPLAFALVVDAFGPRAGDGLLLACATIAWLAFEATAHWYRNQQRQGERQSAGS